jgi:hypothetical protein
MAIPRRLFGEAQRVMAGNPKKPAAATPPRARNRRRESWLKADGFISMLTMQKTIGFDQH